MNWVIKKLFRDQGGWMAIPAIISAAATIFSSIQQNKAASAQAKAQEKAAAAQSGTAPASPTSTAPATAPGATAPGTGESQQAYWNQLLSGTGQVPTGGALPQDIQSMIDQQASLGGGGGGGGATLPA